MTRTPSEMLLELHNVGRYFDVSPPWYKRLSSSGQNYLLRAVDGVDLAIPRGKTFSLVGESGCGKSTLARVAVGLYPPSDGEMYFDGRRVSHKAGDFKVPETRRRIQMVFQDPYASLNPRWRVRRIIGEPISVHEPAIHAADRSDRIVELLDQVGLDKSALDKFPHQFSGGQRQRISIARSLAARPELLICDEPTSALDVSVQAQILNLMRRLQDELGLTYLFISHDLAVIRFVSDFVGVMYLGRIVEWNEADALFRSPKHPYTKMLLGSVPRLDVDGQPEREPIAGEVPSPLSPPTGCHFHPRCPIAYCKCGSQTPELEKFGRGAVRCHAVADGVQTARRDEEEASYTSS